MTAFASVLLGILWGCACGLIGFGIGKPSGDCSASGAIACIILGIVTLGFIRSVTG